MSGEYYTNFPPDFPDENSGGSSEKKRFSISGLFPRSDDTPQKSIIKGMARSLLGFNVFEDVDVEEQRNKLNIIDYSSPGPASGIVLASTNTDDLEVNVSKDAGADKKRIEDQGNKVIDIKTKKIGPYPDEIDYTKNQSNIVSPIPK